jgi:hypothetical protein
MKGPVRRTGRLARLGRLLIGRNKLRRPSDRIEGAVVLTLSAAFLTACVAAVCLAGHVYQSERAAAARLRPAVAVLSQAGPTAGSQLAAARARWRLPDGTQRSGTLTILTAPAIYDARAGAFVPVWLDRSGEPVVPPIVRPGMIFNGLLTGVAGAVGAAIALALCYLLCRMALDRRRLARWESMWAAVGPRWTSRR